MYLTEQYYLYSFTRHLMAKENYQLIHINMETSEIWLSKTNWKQTKVIRLLHKGFDWKNHMKQDIALLFKRVRNFRRQLGNKPTQIYNVYISSLEPVDEWEELKNPLRLEERKPIKMKVFYITEANKEKEQSRLFNEIEATNDYSLEQPDVEEQEREIEQYKYELRQSIYNSNERMKKIFSFGKPRITYYILYVNLFIFLLLELYGGSTNIETLLMFGAKYNPAIVLGEWWRIVTSMFLHIGLIHLLMNMVALYYLGTVVERIFGSRRFVVIYFLAGIAGGLTSFALNVQIAAGASGALFGLFGALLFFGTVYKDLFRQTMGKNLIIILIINLIFGFIVPQIDMGAHLGGLIGGYIASAIVFLPNKKQKFIQMAAFFTYVILFGLLTYYGYIKNIALLEQMLQY